APIAARPGAAHPPLAVPPGPPESTDGYDVDGHFERRMWAFASALLVFALVSVGLNVSSGPAWAEMPAERLLLSVDTGQATAIVEEESEALRPDDDRYLSSGARIEVPASGRARLTFPGGASVVLCPGSRAVVNEVSVRSGRTSAPAGRLTLDSGRVLADTTSPSGAFAALDLTVLRSQGDVTSAGRAWYAVDPSEVTVVRGRVAVGGAAMPAGGGELNCGDGVKVTPPSAGPSEEPVDEPSFPETSAPPTSVAPSTTPTTVPGRTTAPADPGDNDNDNDDDNDDVRPTTTTPPRTTEPTTAGPPPPTVPPTSRPTRTTSKPTTTEPEPPPTTTEPEPPPTTTEPEPTEETKPPSEG
ncbi:cyclic nucleotide-binding protein, partial [Actinoplanes sp. NPDC024001]